MRILSFLLLACLAALAVVIYEVKYETRGLEKRVAELRSSVREERDAIAVLRAEWSHLNRPERVERLARKHLGLRPLAARQMITIDQFPTRWTAPASGSGAALETGSGADALRQPVSAVR